MRRFLSLLAFAALSTPAMSAVGAPSQVEAAAPRGLDGVRFRFQAEGPIRGTPVLSGGGLYFGSDGGFFYALDAKTGAVRWRFAAGAGIASTPAIVSGTAYFTAWDGNLYAVASATGRLRWKVPLGRGIGLNYWDFHTPSPTLSDNALVVGGGDGQLYAIDRLSGRTLWKFEAGARIRSTARIEGDLAVFGTNAGAVIAVDRHTGKQRWRFATTGASQSFDFKDNDTTSIMPAPSIHEGIVTIGGRDGFLYGLDLATGAQRWKTTHDGGSWILSTATQGDRVYSGSGSARFIQSAMLATGAENWRFKTLSAVFGPVIWESGVLLGDDMTGMIFAVDADNGRELWRFPLGDRSLGGAAFGDGIVYTGDDSGMLTALDTSGAAAPGPEVKRLVYAEAAPPADRFEWFQSGVDRVNLSAFALGGYGTPDDAALLAAMEDQVAGRGTSAIVFADGTMPRSAADAAKGPPLLRRFLDAGGIAVFLGLNPLALQYDDKGEVSGVDHDAGGQPLGFREIDRRQDFGYHVSRYTADAGHWGLYGQFVSNGATLPGADSVMLAADQFGNATAWAKRYGTAGGMLLQFGVRRDRPSDLAGIRSAIEYAVAHRMRR